MCFFNGYVTIKNTKILWFVLSVNLEPYVYLKDPFLISILIHKNGDQSMQSVFTGKIGRK